jgi:uncharacterized protein (DUF58 family)
LTASSPATLGPAQRLAAALPRLILAAERLAFAAAPGPHSRRRAGAGDNFWQFRDWQSGDETRRIDWRRSARSDRFLVRDREWEVQNVVSLTLHDTPGLDFSGRHNGETKREHIILLLLATAFILIRSGAHVALTGRTTPRGGQSALDHIALALIHGGDAPRAPQARHIQFGDFLRPDLHFDAAPGGAVIQVLDAAECDFPYKGRILFTGFGAEPPQDAANAALWSAAYRTRLAAQRDAVVQAARAAGQTPLFHRTDAPPATLLNALTNAIAR